MNSAQVNVGTAGRSGVMAALVFLLALFSSWSVQAGTFDKLHFIGFSADGRHVAFQTYGTSDGTGHGYATTTLVNVAENAWVGSPIRTGTESDMYSESVARTRNSEQAAARLQALGIVEGAVGNHVFTRLLTDLTAYQGPVRFAKFFHSNFQDGDFELALEQRDASRPECNVYTPPARKIITLSLKNRTTGNSQLLQQDSSLPRSRSCPDRYQISDVYLNKQLVVVFLRTFGPGFEGPDMRYMAVTGVIE